jgi:hypothetical protein
MKGGMFRAVTDAAKSVKENSGNTDKVLALGDLSSFIAKPGDGVPKSESESEAKPSAEDNPGDEKAVPAEDGTPAVPAEDPAAGDSTEAEPNNMSLDVIGDIVKKIELTGVNLVERMNGFEARVSQLEKTLAHEQEPEDEAAAAEEPAAEAPAAKAPAAPEAEAAIQAPAAAEVAAVQTPAAKAPSAAIQAPAAKAPEAAVPADEEPAPEEPVTKAPAPEAADEAPATVQEVPGPEAEASNVPAPATEPTKAQAEAATANLNA